MPGNASSSSVVAVLRLTGPDDAPDPPPAAVAGPGRPISNSSPSDTFAARLSESRSRCRNAPPAARSASATRAPSGSVTNPGRRTLPPTSTTIDGVVGVGKGANDCAGSGAAAYDV